MPKVKTRRSAKKRFRVTGTGKVLFQRAGMRHNQEKMSRSLQHDLSKEVEVAPENVAGVKRMLGMR